MRRRTLLVLALAAAPGWAQTPLPLGPPLLGYAYDPAAGSILRLSGVPGAALFDAAIPIEPRLAAVFVAGVEEHAIGLDAGRQPLLLGWGDGRLSIRELPYGPVDAAAVFSASGGTVVLYTGAGGPMQVWTGLPGEPRLAAIRPTGFDGSLTAIAVSEDGRVAIGLTIGGQSSVLLLGEGSGRVLATGGRFGALAFSPDGSELLAADAGENRVWVLQARALNPSPRLVASAQDGVAEPVAVAWSREGTRRVVAGRDGAVLLVENSGAIRTVNCECRIDGLHRLRGDAVFRLVDPPKGRTPVFDAGADEPRVVFLPMEVER